MSFISLPTLDAASRTPRPNQKGTTRLQDKTADDKADKKAWEACRQAVWKRDEHKCRACGIRLVKTLGLNHKRYECHHLRPRRVLSDADRVNPMCCVALCLGCHADLKGTPPTLRQIGQTSVTVRFERVR